jgi:DNA-binding winged helix-turn-helix (wHTH) protein
MNTDRILTFGEFRLDPSSGHVYRGAATIPLTPKAFALLVYLVTHAGRLVPKAELISAIWKDVFVGDAVLKSSIRELRKALGDDSSHPDYIETAHRRGYRFMAPVVAIEPTAPVTSLPKVSYARSGNVNIAYQVI